MPLLPDRIETEHLVLRAFRPEDVPHFAPLIGAPEVARWLPRVPQPYTLDDGLAWVEASNAMRRDGGELALLAVRREDGQPVGGAGLIPGTGEIGYWLGVPHQGRGYGTEMARALVRTAFGTLGLPALFAETDPANLRSHRVLEKAGFTGDGRGRYDLTAARWCATRQGARWRALTQG